MNAITLEGIKPDTMLSFQEWCELIGDAASFFNKSEGGELDRVLSIQEWSKLAGFSEKTGREVIDSDQGPKTVQLSPNRIGVRVCDHRTWLAARTRKKAA